MKKIKVEDALGQILAHDLTRIIPGVEKGALFQKGHRIAAEDIPLLLDIGKKNIFVLEDQEEGVHENEAAQRIARAVSGRDLAMTAPSEGKVNLLSPVDGVLRIDETGLMDLLEDPQICFSTATPDLFFEQGALLASCRIIPLMKPEAEIAAIESRFAAKDPFIRVDPLQAQRVGLIITGSEVSEGRIKDAFGPLLVERNEALGGVIAGIDFPGDDQAAIESSIRRFLNEGCTMIQLTGGMSVDPDDCTKDAIPAVCDELVIYGTSVLPGAMFMLAYAGEVPVIGLPGGVAASPFSIFDFVVPRLYAGERLDARTIRRMALGGLLSARR